MPALQTALQNQALQNQAVLGAGAVSTGAVNYVHSPSWDPADYLALASPHRFRIASDAELPSVGVLAKSLMRTPLAPFEALQSAHETTGGSAWLHASSDRSDEETGLILMLPLSWDGEAALRTGRFDASRPQPRHLCRPFDEMPALYLWLCAGADQESRRNIMRTTNAWFSGPCSRLRVYGRAVSEEGVRAFESFGFIRLSPGRPDLFLLQKQGA